MWIGGVGRLWKRLVGALALLSLAFPVAAFAGLFIAIQFGTLKLDPDQRGGSRLFDAIAILVGITIISLSVIVAWRTLHYRKVEGKLSCHGKLG